MDYKLVVLFLLFVSNCANSAHKKDFHQKSHKLTNRQNIFQQSSSNPPVPPIGKEVQNQLRQQVNADSGGMIEVAPNNADAINGLTGTGIGMPFGTPNRRIDKNPLIGANGLTKNSLADIMFGNLKGLVKLNNGGTEAASFNGLQSDETQGGDMRQMLGGQMDGMNGAGMNSDMGNILSNAQPMNLNALAALNNLAGSQGLNAFGARSGPFNGMMNGDNTNGGMNTLGMNGINPNFLGNPTFPGGPMQQPNPLLGMQLMSQLSNMNENQDDKPGKHHKRHHKHKAHHRKSTTKLLLRLLVDKLKDIYELDQMNSVGNKKTDSSTVGKIGLTLDHLGVPKGDVHHGQENRPDSTLSGFQTNLSFPVTISDSKVSEKLHLTDKSSRKNFSGKIPADVDDDDDAKIEKILSGLGIRESDEAAKKTNGINDSTENILKDIKKASELDAKAKAITSSFTPEIKGQERNTENPKARDNIGRTSAEEEMKLEDKGSLSEFHKIKMRNGIDDASSITGVKSDVFPSEMMNYKNPLQGEVTAPEIFSVSSLLNKGIDKQDSLVSNDVDEEATIHDKSLHSEIFGTDASKKSDSSNEIILPYVPSDLNTDQVDLKSLTDTMANDVKTTVKEGERYVKAARVLGAVFKKVKDPVAKQSIETAIKAMMQVMKKTANDNSSSKKHQLPSDYNEKLFEQIQQLNKVFHEMKRNLVIKNKEKRSSFLKKNRNNNKSLHDIIRRKRLHSPLHRKIN